MTFWAAAQEPVVQEGILEVGDRLHIQALSPLIDAPGEMTVIKFGPRAWVLVEYDKTEATEVVTTTEPVKEKAGKKNQMWINFEHVIAVKKLSEGRPPAKAPTGATPSPEPKK